MLESDKKYFKETLGCSEEQMQALIILFDFPVMSRSSIKDREELSKHIGKDDFYDCWNEYEKKYLEKGKKRGKKGGAE